MTIESASRADIKNNPKVTILLLNYNDWKSAIECLESVYRTTYPNWEILVVDNGSENASVAKIKEWAAGNIPVKSKFFGLEEKEPIKYVEELFYDEEENKVKVSQKVQEWDLLPPGQKLLILRIKRNRGFTGGNNIGMKYILREKKTDYIVLLSNDVVVDDNFIGTLMKQASRYPDAGIFCTKIYFYDEPDTIWFAGGYIDWKNEGAHIGYEKKDNHAYDAAITCKYVTGCAMLIKKEVLEKIGLLDESFFAYQEDVDFCIRARKAGYKCMYIPSPRVWHKVGSTLKKEGRMSPLIRYLGTRNKLSMIRKNFGRLRLIEALLRELFVVTPVYIILYASRRHFDLIPAQFQGIIDALRGKNKYLH